jgi:hypothetical protein
LIQIKCLGVRTLGLAVLNLAVNARDAMSSGGSLTISADNVTVSEGDALGIAGEFVALRVADSGAGIPPEIIGRVFEPFFTTKEVGKGTRLGLSQVYGFARQAGGTATVDSVPGRGTTVTLYLPLAGRPATPKAAGAAVPSPSRVSHGVRVLMVEDHSDVAVITRSLLEELGYEVLHAADVAAARFALSREPVDVVLSDIVIAGRRQRPRSRTRGAARAGFAAGRARYRLQRSGAGRRRRGVCHPAQALRHERPARSVNCSTGGDGEAAGRLGRVRDRPYSVRSARSTNGGPAR